MTVIIHFGRRVPRSWFRRGASQIKGLMTFQENIWQMICQSLSTAKKKATVDGRMTFCIEKDTENEDMNYQIEWCKVIIQGTPDMEEDEYNDVLKMYDKLGKVFKKDFEVDQRLASHFKTKMLNSTKVEEAYQKGYGSVESNNIANKLLEMGILTHVEWNKDFDSRENVYCNI